MTGGEWLDDAGRDFLADLARGDEGAETLMRSHKAAQEAAVGLLELGAAHYTAVRHADFGEAGRLAEGIAEMGRLLAIGHRKLLPKEEG